MQAFPVGTSEKAVRLNSIGSGFELDDLKAVLQSKSLDTLMLPKVSAANDIHHICSVVDKIAPGVEINLIACIESAIGICNIKEIATADPRVDTLLFAAEDYCADVGLRRSSSRLEMLHARQTVVTTAAAYGLQSIDLVCVDFKNDDILREECIEGRNFGFTGKQAIHPRQLQIINDSFSPTIVDIEKATRIITGYKEFELKGIGAFEIDGKMIDTPMVKWAEGILAKMRMFRR